LKKVTLSTNQCISSDSEFEYSDGTLSTMNQKLEQCYTNCAYNDYCNKIMIDDLRSLLPAVQELFQQLKDQYEENDKAKKPVLPNFISRSSYD
jgi:hypothetical protein